MSEPPRSHSSMTFRAVEPVLAEMVAKLTARFRLACRSGAPDGELETFARIARGEAYSAITESYRRGIEAGERALRSKLGLPSVEEDTPTGKIQR